MKSYPLLAQKLLCEPWAIMPLVLSSMCEQFAAHTGIGAPHAAADDKVGPSYMSWTGERVFYHPQVQVGGGLALAQCHGIIGKHLGSLEMECGGYDVALLEEQMDNIAGDDSIKAVILDIRSPGGSVLGIESAATSIMEVRASGKKVYAYTSEMCASAAYWLASACDEIHAEKSAIVGSISTILAGVDSSAAFAKEGLVRKVFATGIYKATGMMGKQWTEEEEKYLWERTLTIDADFKGFVDQQRGLTAEQMQGQWWHASHAPAGLVDSTSFRNLSQFIESVYATL